MLLLSSRYLSIFGKSKRVVTAARNVHDTFHVQTHHIGHIHYCGIKTLIASSVSQFAITVVTPGIYL
jgi:hypothetical protein